MNTFYPTITKEILNNPLMGWAPDARHREYPQPHRLAFAMLKWSELEKIKGKYDFELFEKINNFDFWEYKDVKIILRIVMDLPGKNRSKEIPDWLYALIKNDGKWYNNEFGLGFSPNYNNPLLIKYHQKLLKAVGKRYDNDKRIALVEIGSIGHWGEWHTNPDLDPFPKRIVSDQYVKHYLHSFKKKKLLLRRPQNIAKKNQIGLFNDMIGDKKATDNFLSWIQNGYLCWLTREKNENMINFWHRSPSGGEFAHKDKFLKADVIEQTEKQIKESHTSWIGPCCPAYLAKNCQDQKSIDRLLLAMGYRFEISWVKMPREVKVKEKLPITICLNNTGAAPFYFQWPVEFMIIDSNGLEVTNFKAKVDISKWLPGRNIFSENIKLPKKMENGTYQLSIAIIDPDTKCPGINFPLQEKCLNGRYIIGNFTINNKLR